MTFIAKKLRNCVVCYWLRARPSIHVNQTATWTCGLCAIPRRPPPRLTPPDYNSYRAYYPRSRSARYFCGVSAYTHATHARRHEMRLTCVRIRARNIHLVAAVVGRVCMRMHICICIHASAHLAIYMYTWHVKYRIRNIYQNLPQMFGPLRAAPRITKPAADNGLTRFNSSGKSKTTCLMFNGNYGYT